MSGCDTLALLVFGLFPLLLLLNVLWMPGFWRCMPKDKPGTWIAVAMITTPFRGAREVAWKRCRGYRSAYLAARWLALKVDLATPWCGGEIGVDWGVRATDPDRDPEDI